MKTDQNKLAVCQTMVHRIQVVYDGQSSVLGTRQGWNHVRVHSSKPQPWQNVANNEHCNPVLTTWFQTVFFMVLPGDKFPECSHMSVWAVIKQYCVVPCLWLKLICCWSKEGNHSIYTSMQFCPNWEKVISGHNNGVISGHNNGVISGHNNGVISGHNNALTWSFVQS
jgi:hypothetical protein